MNLGIWRTLSFVAAESVLLLSLLTLALLVFRSSITNEAILEMGIWKNVAVIFVCFAVYWAMQTLRRNLAAFWLIATLVILAQGLAIWPHNALEWSQFFGVEVSGAEGRSLFKDTILLLIFSYGPDGTQSNHWPSAAGWAADYAASGKYRQEQHSAE